MSEQSLEFDTTERIKALLEKLDAYINHYHGGSVEFIDYENDTLTVRLGGSCETCPLSTTTLNGWVAGTIRQFFPEIKHVVAVDANASQPA